MTIRVQPLGFVEGTAARDAIASRRALPLAGGPSAFTLAMLHQRGVAARIVPAVELDPALAAPLTQARAYPTGAWPLVMGIVNATPDSFSDGGQFFDPDAAIAHGRSLRAQGADLLDIGGESTRPGATPVDAHEEQRRVLPVLRALCADGPVSIDTRNASTMRAALDAGASMLNDVSALTYDPDARAVARDAQVPVVLMHMRGTPQTMQAQAQYADLLLDVLDELEARIDQAVAAGIDRARLVIDPGLGFAKTPEQSALLLARVGMLHGLGLPILVGASRKRFLATLGATGDRLGASVAAALEAARQGAAILRVHDVAATVEARAVWRGTHQTG
ncbi:dihydropteroate synthase [Roseiterribacter gracilis]|uniref:Dihydropteroate synthase n=1 Tax=Roseiterribacter gracilis TaxID=2812848 RepID=A0A8S8XK78_9PROT|nr:dihydropteroate synthase [Rhodospirillales bacterium TMPK1]